MSTYIKGKQKLAIVGGGASGNMAVIYLEKIAREQNLYWEHFDLYLIDPKGFDSGGIGYGECHETSLLNSIPSEMSPWDRDAFPEFLENRYGDVDLYGFYPRADYKEFLNEAYRNALDGLRQRGVKDCEIKKRADLERNDNGTWRIEDANNTTILTELDSQEVLLTVGYGPSRLFESLKASHGNDDYIHSIYPSDIVYENNTIRKPDVHIAAIGAGPALYDFAYMLNQVSPNPNLTIFSGSHGAIKVRDIAYEKRTGDPNVELKAFNGLPEGFQIKDIQNALAAEFNTHSAKGIPDRRIALDAMKQMGTILKRTSPNVAIAFRRSSGFRRLQHLATPVPQRSHNVLDLYNPERVSERVAEEGIKRHNGRFSIRTEFGHQQEFDIVVRLIGHGRTTHPIFEKMLDKGYVAKDSHLDILQTEDGSSKLIGCGIPCVGPATHFGTDGVETFDAYINPYMHGVLNRHKEQPLQIHNPSIEREIA